jgi:hypothetical protein
MNCLLKLRETKPETADVPEILIRCINCNWRKHLPAEQSLFFRGFVTDCYVSIKSMSKNEKISSVVFLRKMIFSEWCFFENVSRQSVYTAGVSLMMMER